MNAQLMIGRLIMKPCNIEILHSRIQDFSLSGVQYTPCNRR